MNQITVTTDFDTGRVSSHLYGHFTEHLGPSIVNRLDKIACRP